MANSNLYLGNGALLGDIISKLKIQIKDSSVTTGKIADSAVTPDKLSSEVYSYLGNKITVNIGDYAALTISIDESTGQIYFIADNETKINIGKIPVMKGEYISGSTYQRLWQVTYLGSTYQSKIDNNSYPPAQLIDNVVSHINTDKWLCIADASDAKNLVLDVDSVIGKKISNMYIDGTTGHLWINEYA